MPTPAGKEITRAKSIRKSQNVTGSVPSLTFPAAAVDPVTQLSSLTDNRSNYAAVAKSCLMLNQFAGAEPTVTHDTSTAKVTSTLLSALMECVNSHEDRRCRLLASKTLALVARSAYARIRHSPLLYSVRDGTLNRLEDDVGTDVPVALCTVALDDADDGVSAGAIEALGILTLNSSSMVGTMVDDELMRDVEAIAHSRPSPYAPSLTSLGDEDPCIPQMELQSRVYENVLSPRLWRLLRRILHYDSTTFVQRTLPFLTACLVHLVKLTPSATFGMDRPTYAKRWIEVDSLGLVHDVVTNVLLPSMQSSNDGALAHTAVLSSLRLINVCPHASWVPELCRWSVLVLTEQLSAVELVEHKLNVLATLLVALRGVPIRERLAPLEVIANEVRFLPGTTSAPSDVTCPGFQTNGLYRRPARVQFLAEIALSIFLDGPADDSRPTILREFLDSPEVGAILSGRGGKKKKKIPRSWASNRSTTSSQGHDHSEGGTRAPGGPTPTEEFTGTHVGEEFVLAFCQVAVVLGEKVLPRGKQTPMFAEWLQGAVLVLTFCSPCINWKSRMLDGNLSEEDRDSRTLFTMLSTAQAWYVRLMYQCLYVTGMLSPASSVSLHLLPLATPPHILLLEELALANTSLASYAPVKGAEFVLKDVVTLVDQFLEYKFREGLPSRHIRISLLSLLSDQWVQSVISENNQSMTMNDMNARELLTMLSEEISKLSKDLSEGSGIDKVHLNYIDVCVACVENLALTAGNLGERVGSARPDIAEDSKYLVSVALAALSGRNLRDSDVLDDDQSPPNSMLPICSEAAKRIEASLDDGENAKFSLLVTTAARDFSRRSGSRGNVGVGGVQFAEVTTSPFVLTEEFIDAPLVSGDAHIHAYYAHYCQQIVQSRTEASIKSSCITDTRTSTEDPRLTRPRNWLRLSVPFPVATRTHRGRITKGVVKTISGGSDPVSFILAYSMKRCPRFDCEPQYKLMVTIRMTNITAVEISQGVRMDLRVIHQRSAFAIAEDEEEEEEVLTSTSAVYKMEIKPGDHVTWEVAVDDWPATGTIELHPSITFRDIESDHSSPKMIKEKSEGEMDEKVRGERDKRGDTVSADDDTQTETGTSGGLSNDGSVVFEEDETFDVTMTGEPVVLSPMVGMQPCPLVFFGEDPGNISVFRFLWYQMPHRLPEMVLFPLINGSSTGTERDDYASSIAKISNLAVSEVIHTLGVITKGWAFMTLTGYRLLCIMIQPFEGPRTEDATERRSRLLYFRSDNEALLFSLMGSDLARNSVVSALTEGQWTCDTF